MSVILIYELVNSASMMTPVHKHAHILNVLCEGENKRLCKSIVHEASNDLVTFLCECVENT